MSWTLNECVCLTREYRKSNIFMLGALQNKCPVRVSLFVATFGLLAMSQHSLARFANTFLRIWRYTLARHPVSIVRGACFIICIRFYQPIFETARITEWFSSPCQTKRVMEVKFDSRVQLAFMRSTNACSESECLNAGDMNVYVTSYTKIKDVEEFVFYYVDGNRVIFFLIHSLNLAR